LKQRHTALLIYVHKYVGTYHLQSGWNAVINDTWELKFPNIIEVAFSDIAALFTVTNIVVISTEYIEDWCDIVVTK